MNTIANMCELLAQAASPVAAPVQAAGAGMQVDSLWDFVVKGGPMMIPIGLASLIALAIFIERTLTLRRRNVIPPDFLPGLHAALQTDDNGQPDRALDYCARSTSPLASILATAIKHREEPIDRLEKYVTEAGRRAVLKLRRFLRALAVIASIAPLLGLLGTIFGMIRAFQTVASSGAALGRTELLAKGIYEAMITTAAGLLVAIPVLIGYHWIAARIDSLVLEMDHMTVTFVEEHTRGRRWRAVRQADDTTVEPRATSEALATVS